jgi:uncharacterized protein (DUF488 family)
MCKIGIGEGISVIYTIGYEGLTIGEFTDILKAHAIKILVDVRELPLSRKRGFSKNILSNAVEEVGIKYIHKRELGAPREVRHALRRTDDWAAYCTAYEKVLKNNQESLISLSKLSNSSRVCLMCFEEDYKACHRSLITERMIAIGLTKSVSHLDLKKRRLV